MRAYLRATVQTWALMPHLTRHVSGRFWAIIWGAILTGVFVLLPSFKHLRILCILGLVGTSYTAVYIWIQSGISGLHSNWSTGPTSLEASQTPTRNPVATRWMSPHLVSTAGQYLSWPCVASGLVHNYPTTQCSLPAAAPRLS